MGRVEQARRIDILALISPHQLKKAGRNEWSGPCPSCGGKNRFSIRTMDDGEQRWVCRKCSDGRYHDAIDFWRHFHGGTFAEALDALVGAEGRPEPVAIRRKVAETPPEPRKRPDWYGKSRDWYNARFRRNMGQVTGIWQAYRMLTPETIDHFHLGFGQLPSSRCKHDRLILPVFDQERLVNLRGRSLGCECDGKWLTSGGWSLDDLPLYNGGAINDGALVIITESPIEPVQISESQPVAFDLVGDHVPETAIHHILELAQMGQQAVVGVATYSTAYWRDAWTELVRQASAVVVAYDNDLAGNGGGKHHHRLQAKRKAANLPPVNSRGTWLVNHLLDAGVPACLLDWNDAPVKMDVGKYLEER